MRCVPPPDPTLLGRILAEDASARMRSEGISESDLAVVYATHLKGLAEELVRGGMSRAAVAAWLDVLTSAYRQDLSVFTLDSVAYVTSESHKTQATDRNVSMKPALIIVGADKGGVGKTTVSRLLLDYLASHRTPARAFDAEFPRGALARFHPEITEIVDLTRAADQMKIVDTIQGAGPKVSVIDVRAGHLGPTLKALEAIGFIDAAKEAQFTFCLFHVLGPSLSSFDEISTTAPYVADAQYFLVKNHVNDAAFFEWDPVTYRAYFDEVKNAREIAIPKLNELAYEQVELAGMPFSDFVENKRTQNSFVLRGYVRTWMRQVEQEFDRVRLMDVLSRPPKAPEEERARHRRKGELSDHGDVRSSARQSGGRTEGGRPPGKNASRPSASAKRRT